MISNSNGDKVSAKEAAKEALAVAVKLAVSGEFPEGTVLRAAGGSDMTEKEAAKVKEQLEKISTRLLTKLAPAE